MHRKMTFLVLSSIMIIWTAAAIFAAEKPTWQGAYRQILEKELKRNEYGYFSFLDLNQDSIPELVLAKSKMYKYEPVNMCGDFAWGKGPLIIYTYKNGQAEEALAFPQYDSSIYEFYNAALVGFMDKQTDDMTYTVFVNYKFKEYVNVEEELSMLDGLGIGHVYGQSLNRKNPVANHAFSTEFRQQHTARLPIYQKLSKDAIACIADPYDPIRSQKLVITYEDSDFSIRHPFNFTLEPHVKDSPTLQLISSDHKVAVYVSPLTIDAIPDYPNEQAILIYEIYNKIIFRDFQFHLDQEPKIPVPTVTSVYTMQGETMKGYTKYFQTSDGKIVYRVIGCVFENETDANFALAKSIVDSFALKPGK